MSKQIWKSGRYSIEHNEAGFVPMQGAISLGGTEHWSQARAKIRKAAKTSGDTVEISIFSPLD
jgi:hypothetical protein